LREEGEEKEGEVKIILPHVVVGVGSE